MEEDNKQRYEAEQKKRAIENAEQRRHGPVDDSQVVDEVFGFIDEHADSEATAPSKFRVII